MRLRLSREAARDIDEAWDYSAGRWSPDRADALLDRFHEAFSLLAEFPESGRRRDELSRGLRSLPASGFVILYQIFEGVLEIVRVVYGSRDLEELFSGSEEEPRE